ncbi:MAG: transcriptional regulator [Candidatus Kryptonium sp.]|nr:transcriptional regulator [Candidatus Kryptonium sp.]
MKAELDEIIHQPTRTKIMVSLYALNENEEIEFINLRDLLNLSDGNLSSHLAKLEEVGYVKIRKTFDGKRPKTYISLTTKGRKAFENYIRALKKIFEAK